MTVIADTEREFIRFGTDGWRAVIGDGYTFFNLERVSQAYADYLNNYSASHNESQLGFRRAKVVVGYDRRFLSKEFALRAAEIMRGNEFEVLLFDQDVPTPLVSWAVREENAEGGIVITASHNSPEFNGFKIKEPWGGSAPVSVTTAVENCIGRSPRLLRHAVEASAMFTERAFTGYRRQVSNLIDFDRIRSVVKNVVVDPMHGSGGKWVESFVHGGSLNVETIRSERDPMFGGIDPEPIDRNLAFLKQRVLETKSIIGLATDGDADRLGAVDERGRTMTMHEVVPLLLLHLIRMRKMTGDVVSTFSQSVLIKKIAANHNLRVHETPIGFKYIAELMLGENILIGAEESGGIGVKNHLPERDGVVNSLLLLEAVISSEKMPSDMVRDLHHEFGEFYFDRCDTILEVTKGQDIVEKFGSSPPAVVGSYSVADISTIDGTKLSFADESWLLFRQSGTEPVLRVYAEATSRQKLDELLRAAVSMVNGQM